MTLHLGSASRYALSRVLDTLVTDGGVIHLDLETMGVDATDPDAWVVGLGLANAAGVWYFDTRDWAPGDTAWQSLASAARRCGWAAYNVPFDGAWLWRAWGAGTWVPPTYCTHATFRLLTTEGWTGQRWDLGTACRDVLGWATEHKDVIAEALVAREFTKKNGSPDKAQMWRLAYTDPEMFGTYCGRDADASWQLGQVFGPVVDSYPALRRAVREEWPALMTCLIEQQHAGIRLDTAGLHAHLGTLTRRVAEIDVALSAHPQTGPLVKAEEARITAEFYAPHVAYRRSRATIDECIQLNRGVATAGLQFTEGQMWPMNGHTWYFAPSTAKALRPEQRAVGGYWYRTDPVYTPRNADKPAPKVNWASDTWLRQVLYTLYPATRVETTDFHGNPVVMYDVAGAHGTVRVASTDGGLQPVSLPVLPVFGDVGKLLAERSEAEKEASYVQSYLDASRDAYIHIRLKAPGTVSGRLSGDGGLNIQQVPKTQGAMGAFRPPEGWSLIDLDFASLEPKVMAYFSQDPGYLELFASGKPHTDVYLWVAAQAFPDKGIAAVYAPDGVPTKASVKAAKAQFKSIRELTKRIHLAKSYGAGAAKIYQGIALSGELPEVTLEAVQALHKRHGQIFEGVRDWEYQLRDEWTANSGWVRNGFGRPIPVAEAKLKDIVNVFCQSTGHDALARFVYHIERLRTQRGVPMRPFHVDSHDATTWAFRDGHENEARSVYEDALAALNSELSPPAEVAGPDFIPLTGTIEIGHSLWDFKKE